MDRVLPNLYFIAQPALLQGSETTYVTIISRFQRILLHIATRHDAIGPIL